LIYQDRPIGQKAAKERLKRRQEKDKVGEGNYNKSLTTIQG